MNKLQLYDIIRFPVVTEKSTALAEVGKYVFRVDMAANKIAIKKAVSTIFNVTVKSVRTISMNGKIKKYKGRLGRRPDFKKAIVTLEKGQTIDKSLEI